MNKTKLPCNECLTLSICQLKFIDIYNNEKIVSNHYAYKKEYLETMNGIHAFQKIYNSCSLLTQYLFEPPSPKLDEIKMNKAFNFFIYLIL